LSARPYTGRADPRGAQVTVVTIHSHAVGATLHTTVVVPKATQADNRKRPLLIFLHGRGGDHNSFRGDDAMFVALSRLGPRAPIVAFPDGGDHSYWHNRADGDWGDYVVNEVVPQVARSVDANPRRVAIGGISMGGFGAYDLALLHPGRFCAVGGHSAALWFEGGEIKRYDKKNKVPQMKYIDYGLGLFRAEAFAGYPRNTVVDLATVQTELCQTGQLAGFEIKERFYEIGSHAGLEELNQLLQGGTLPR